MPKVVTICAALGSLFIPCVQTASAQAPPPSTHSRKTQPPNGIYAATAYAVTGITASGEWTHRHVIAADPAILPIGSRIQVKRAGRYSGEYVVADTGAAILGRKLDIYMPTNAECKKFGVRRVRVQVIELGHGTKAETKQADQVVKKDVATDVSKGVVGNAATEVDWNAKGAATKKAAETGTLPPPKPDHQ